jgi:hypothetical protein
MLMNSRKHSKFTGAKAIISHKVGGKFSAYGKYIQGINLELVPARRIVQAWAEIAVSIFEWKLSYVNANN